MRRTLFFTSLIVLAGCGDSAMGPGSGRCATNQGIEICSDRSSYPPGASVGLTITNQGTTTVFKDFCSVKIVGKTDRSVPFEARYDPTLLCGLDVTPAEIVANMVELPPGASIEEQHRLTTFAFQGFYRVNVWFLDENGDRISTDPFFTGTFDVIPTAGK